MSDQISYLTAEEEDRTLLLKPTIMFEKSNPLPDGKGGTLMTRKRGLPRVAPSDATTSMFH